MAQRKNCMDQANIHFMLVELYSGDVLDLSKGKWACISSAGECIRGSYCVDTRRMLGLVFLP